MSSEVARKTNILENPFAVVFIEVVSSPTRPSHPGSVSFFLVDRSKIGAPEEAKCRRKNQSSPVQKKVPSKTKPTKFFEDWKLEEWPTRNRRRAIKEMSRTRRNRDGKGGRENKVKCSKTYILLLSPFFSCYLAIPTIPRNYL